jgi:protein-export membrane protein SecD
MGKNRLKLVLVVVALLAGAFYIYPTLKLVSLSPDAKADMGEEALADLESRALRLGLDLQGGMHLVLEVDPSELSEDEARDAIDRALEIIRNRVDQFGVSEPSIQRQGDDRIIVQLPGVQDAHQAKTLIGQTALLEFMLVRSAAEFTETLRRIDEYLFLQSGSALKELDDSEEAPEETAEEGAGDAMSDSADTAAGAADDLFAEESPEEDVSARAQLTAKLRFFRTGEQDQAWVPEELVEEVDSILNLPGVKGIMPFGTLFAWGRELDDFQGQKMKALYLLTDRAEVTGKSVSNAIVQIGLDSNAPNAPGVSLTLTGEGSHDFARVTGDNIGRRLAIVLDRKVQSAPVIKSRIPRGNASITGGFVMDDAKILAIVLRAGALPAPLEIVEERTVGPSLGRDSIRQGLRAALLGGLVVALFMIIYYRGAGLIALVALMLNLFFLMAVMAGLKATLTLPGIAGIILTIGMAVDANVLIFERIREEIRNRKTVRAAIEGGYGRAFRTILDANVTTLITAFVLLQFGTASIKGFAVTLSVGIVSSMFTALIMTRLAFDFLVDRFALKKLSI